MPGFDSDPVGGGGTLYATNVDFTGTSFTQGSRQITSNGQLLIGSAVLPNIQVGTITSPLGTVSIGYSMPNITIDIAGSAQAVEHLTGNSGGMLNPIAHNFNIFGASVAAGTSPVTTVGAAATITVNVQKTQAIAATDATKVGLAVFDSADFTVDANGFVSAVGTGFLKTHTGNSGGAIAPTANNINTLGTGSITISGAGSTLTTQLTGLTNHAVLVGAGTATITNVGPSSSTGQVLQNNAAADPSYSTATYPSTTTVNQILYSSATNTVTGLATANNGVLTTGTTGIPVITALSANGQLIIGSGSGAPIAATLTAGSGITITNAANSITIAQTNPSGFPWTDVTGATQTISTNNGYVTDHANVTYTLPATANLGDTFIIVGKTGITTIAQNANQQILIGASSSTVGVGGSVAGNLASDSGTFYCVTAGASTVWRGLVFGTWTVT